MAALPFPPYPKISNPHHSIGSRYFQIVSDFHLIRVSLTRHFAFCLNSLCDVPCFSLIFMDYDRSYFSSISASSFGGIGFVDFFT